MAMEHETFGLLIDTVRRFVDERLRPLEAAVEEADVVSSDIVAEMRELGFFGLSIPQEYGGLALTMSEEVRVVFELGRTTPAFRSVFGTNVGIGSQALAYKIGALTIQRLRKKAEAELGGKFDIRAFHAQVLMTGSLPLPILEQKIDRWIAATKAS